MKKSKKSKICIYLIFIFLVLGSLFFCKTYFSNEKKDQITKQNQNPTLTTFLKTAMEPVGQTMYVWGGGWNEEDTGSGEETRTIGISSRWNTFFQQQDSTYNVANTQYQIHDGLDCSGYVGWVLYNVFETENGKDGYVNFSGKMIDDCVNRGWGKKISRGNIQNYHCGDIMANENHIFIVLGQCEDGSLLLVHSCPPGVRICGTPTKEGSLQSQAIQIATRIMEEKYPDWYAKYSQCYVDYSYLTDYDQFCWNDTLKNKNALEKMDVQNRMHKILE